MSKVNTVDENLKEIFDDMDAANEYRQQLSDELQAENDLLWSVIDKIRDAVNSI